MKTIIHLLEGTDLEYFITDDNITGNQINDYFYKDGATHFINNTWNVIELANDYFIESLNFTLIEELMKLSNDDYLFCASPTSPKTVYYKLPIKQNIEKLRKFVDENMLFTDVWYFMSPSERWACISVYDYDSVYIGYDPSFEPLIEKIIQSNPNFVMYLKKKET